MSKPAEVHTLLSARWSAIEEAAKGQPIDADGTVRPRTAMVSGSRRSRALDRLLVGGRISSADRRLDVHDVLGMGGMGVVHLGTQASLDRAVAVKGVRPDRRSADATVKLLQEAFIAGRLEHPNIIPIYDIGVDGEGEPLIVQQRVAGTSWSELAWDPAALSERFSVQDPLEWNLAVLMQVCNAIHYAHAQGIVHLDLKPGNVMVGAFGEVLLLDWGLAMSLRDDASGRLPLAAENEDVIGTPGYMAPEMLSQGELPLTARTDVYLLGATLYALLSGSPPHRGSTALAMMYAACTRSPEPILDAPPELVAICERAMAPDPSDRFASAEELRRALADFVHHRGAAQLAREAETRTLELEALLAQTPVPDREVQGAFSAARFGFEQALASWPAAPVEARSRLLEAMARYELGRDNPQAAADLLAGLPSPPAELVARIASRRAELAALGARVEELEQQAAAYDPQVGQRTRVFILAVLGLAFVISPMLRILRPPDEEMIFRLGLAMPMLFLALLGVMMVWGRDSMLRTQVNRNAALHLAVFLVGQMAMTMAANRIGVSTERALPLLMVLWSVGAAMYAVHAEARVWPMVIGYLAGAAGALAVPAYQWHITVAANLVFLITSVVIWWPRPFLPRR